MLFLVLWYYSQTSLKMGILKTLIYFFVLEIIYLQPPKEDNFSIKCIMARFYIAPKSSFSRRFHCF